MFRHFPPNKTMLKLIRLIIKAFFIYTTCLSDPVEKSSKITPLKGNLNPNPPCTVSGLVLATANDEIPDICLSFSPKITRKKIGGMKYLTIIVGLCFSGPDGVLGEIPGFHPRDPGSNPGKVFSLFFNFHPFLPLFRDF